MPYAFMFFVTIILGAFVLGWYFVPKGRLTKITATIWLSIIASYEFLQEQWYMMRDIVPPEYSAWLVGVFLGLTVVAAFRPSRKY